MGGGSSVTLGCQEEGEEQSHRCPKSVVLPCQSFRAMAEGCGGHFLSYAEIMNHGVITQNGSRARVAPKFQSEESHESGNFHIKRP